MSADLLCEQFERMVETPDAVQRLKPFIVELGIRGDLAGRSTGPEASYDRIAQGMESLVQSRPKYKWKPTRLSLAPEQTRVPAGWCQASIGDTGLFVNGLAFKPSDWGMSGRPIIRIQNLSGMNDEYHYTSGDFSIDNLADSGDLLVSWSATLDAFIWPGPEGVVNQHIFKVIPNTDAVTPEFLYWLLKHEVRQLAQSQHAHGLAMMHINRGPFLAHAVAVPPLEEQQRIADTLNHLMTLCDRLEAMQLEREVRRDALRSVSLERLATSSDAPLVGSNNGAALDVLAQIVTRPEHVSDVRRSILNLAVRGQLVPQVTTDEPGARLLESVGVDHSVDDDLDPAGWARTTVGRLASLVTSGSRGWAEFYSDSGASFVRAQNIRFGRLRLDDLAHVTLPPRNEGKRTRVEMDDVLIVITGAGVTTPAWVNVDLREAYVSQHVGLVKLRLKAVAPWVLLCLMAPVGCRDELIARAYGAGKPGLNLDNIRTLSIPVPPLAEQERIVFRVNELMLLCDQLEVALTSTRQHGARLLSAILSQTLAAGTDASGAQELRADAV
jgi:type I restriction enzyme S subunit